MFYLYCSHQTHLVSCFAAERTGSLGACGWILVILSGIFTIILFPITIWFSLRVSDRKDADDRNHAGLGCCCVIHSNSPHPPSLLQIVQEYERTVIFRLGRITDRKAKGPGRHCLTHMVPCYICASSVFHESLSFNCVQFTWWSVHLNRQMCLLALCGITENVKCWRNVIYQKKLQNAICFINY